MLRPEIGPLGKSLTCRGVFLSEFGWRGAVWGGFQPVAGITAGITKRALLLKGFFGSRLGRGWRGRRPPGPGRPGPSPARCRGRSACLVRAAVGGRTCRGRVRRRGGG